SATRNRGRRIVRRVTRSDKHVDQWHVTVLRNHIFQPIELVAHLKVVRTAPAALEESNVLIKLVVLAGIKQRKALIIGRRSKAAILLQTVHRSARSRERIPGIVHSATAAELPRQVRTRRWPTEVVIVGKEITEAGGRDYFRSQSHVGPEVVSGVGLRKAMAGCKLSERGKNPERV